MTAAGRTQPVHLYFTCSSSVAVTQVSPGVHLFIQCIHKGSSSSNMDRLDPLDGFCCCCPSCVCWLVVLTESRRLSHLLWFPYCFQVVLPFCLLLYGFGVNLSPCFLQSNRTQSKNSLLFFMALITLDLFPLCKSVHFILPKPNMFACLVNLMRMSHKCVLCTWSEWFWHDINT